ncbi:hypothetical protein JCM1393_25040 [Clostridium carnis]
MNERLKLIRKTLNVNQAEIGARLGVTKSSISRLEKGINNFTEQMIKLICSEFKVDYIWFTTGEGDMFANIPDVILDELALEYNLDELDKKIILEYLKLDKESRDILKNYIKNIFIK